MKKRLFSILLALCMVLCLVPTTAFAEGKTEETPVCTCETACAEETMNRVGGGDEPPSSHTTVRTVRYTAVSIVDVHRLIGCG